LRHAAKIRGEPPSISVDQGRSIPTRQDKQMPNTASALLDTVTEPMIAVEG
jgi:hypothetical protein